METITTPDTPEKDASASVVVDKPVVKEDVLPVVETIKEEPIKVALAVDQIISVTGSAIASLVPDIPAVCINPEGIEVPAAVALIRSQLMVLGVLVLLILGSWKRYKGVINALYAATAPNSPASVPR